MRLISGIFFLVLGFLVACKSGPSTTPEAASPEEPMRRSEQPMAMAMETTGCLEDYKVNRGAAELMKNSWKMSFEHAHGTSSDIDYSRSFTRAKMQELLDQCADCDGIRIYFACNIAPETFPVSPEILMINTNSCTESGATVLVSQASTVAGGRNITIEEGAIMTELWRDALGTKGEQTPGWIYGDIFAYNFQRSKIEAILADPTVTEIRFYYTIRIEDGDQVGAKGELLLDLMAEGLPASSTVPDPFVDFAVPCPMSCQPSSILQSGN